MKPMDWQPERSGSPARIPAAGRGFVTQAGDSAHVSSPEFDSLPNGRDGQDGQDRRSQERREALDAFWVSVKRLPTYARLVAALARDPRVPNRARAMLAVGGAYLVSPIDLVPGIIPVAGQLDDMYIVLMAVRQALRMAPKEVADEYLERYQLDDSVIDEDLAAIRRLVRVGVSQGARWSWTQLDRLGRRVGDMVTRRMNQEQ
jgi:uncharacterized membrane protein YkvA (DUF1232 family)